MPIALKTLPAETQEAIRVYLQFIRGGGTLPDEPPAPPPKTKKREKSQ